MDSLHQLFSAIAPDRLTFLLLSLNVMLGKTGLTIHLTPITRVVSCHLSVLCFPGTPPLHESLPVEVILVFAVQTQRVFCLHSLVLFYRLYIFWHISNLKMLDHCELRTYFQCVYLYQMKMFIFRGRLIEVGGQL